MKDSERDPGWWCLWLRRRQQDADRQWFGRGKYRSCVAPLFEGEYEHGHYVGASRPPNSEDTIVTLVDVQAAIRRLQPCYQRVLALTYYGYTPLEIAAILHTDRYSVDSMTYRARKEVRTLCA